MDKQGKTVTARPPGPFPRVCAGGKALIGRLALSKAGKDKGRILVIVGLCRSGENTVFVADGRRRRIERPKKKSLKHLHLLPEIERLGEYPAREGQTVQTDGAFLLFTNRALRRATARFGEAGIMSEKPAMAKRGKADTETRNETEEGSFCRKTT